MAGDSGAPPVTDCARLRYLASEALLLCLFVRLSSDARDLEDRRLLVDAWSDSSVRLRKSESPTRCAERGGPPEV